MQFSSCSFSPWDISSAYLITFRSDCGLVCTKGWFLHFDLFLHHLFSFFSFQTTLIHDWEMQVLFYMVNIFIHLIPNHRGCQEFRPNSEPFSNATPEGWTLPAHSNPAKKLTAVTPPAAPGTDLTVASCATSSGVSRWGSLSKPKPASTAPATSWSRGGNDEGLIKIDARWIVLDIKLHINARSMLVHLFSGIATNSPHCGEHD
jgi:hypothetical protein